MIFARDHDRLKRMEPYFPAPAGTNMIRSMAAASTAGREKGNGWYFPASHSPIKSS
jgi:hypothetical protein